MKTSWWDNNGSTYDIGESPSLYLASDGARFLKKYGVGERRVDFGTWTGRNLGVLVELGSEVVATDTARARNATASARTRFPKVTFLECPLTKIPLEDSSVGGGICWRVLHNLTMIGEMINALSEINRVLAPRAPLVIAVRGKDCDDARINRYARIISHSNGVGAIRTDIYFTQASLRSILTQIGFIVDALTLIEEGEEINGRTVINPYMAGHLTKTGRPSASSLAMAERLILRP